MIRAMADFLPRGEAAFSSFVVNSASYVYSHLPDFGLVAADMARINAALPPTQITAVRKSMGV
jgi:hypothetical protein